MEIIEGGLSVKLELKAVKEQFVKLLKNFDDFEQNKQPGAKPTLGTTSSPSKALSTARARVRALYEARKNRLNARRSQKSTAPGPMKIPLSNRHWRRSNDGTENKENQVPDQRLNPPPRHHYVKNEQRASFRMHTARQHGVPYRQQIHPDRITCSGQRLAPIHEFNRLNHVIGCVSPCASKMVATTYESDGEYVTLKDTPICRSGVNSPRTPTAMSAVRNTLNCTADTTVWNVEDDLHNRSADNTAELSSNEYDSSPERNVLGGNAVQFANSELIGEVYTSPIYKQSLRDVSNITNMSRASLRQQTSGVNLSAALSNTFYPLQSTFSYPLHSTLNNTEEFNITRIMPDQADNESSPNTTPTPNDNSEDNVFGCKKHNDKSLESIHAYIHNAEVPPQLLPRHPKTLVHKPAYHSHTQNDSPIYINKNTSSHLLQQTTISIPSTRTAPRPKDETDDQEMCKCGLHPAYIKCSYNDEDTPSTDGSDELVSGSSHLVRDGMRMRGEGRSTEKKLSQRRRSRNTVTDTDCDSSYLSEYVDNEPTDIRQSNDIVYDQAKGCMKLLRRQTANTHLHGSEEFRYPQPLSESDFLFDFDETQKHLSLEATRSSMPDLSGLSGFVTSTDEGGEMTDTTIHASRLNESTLFKTPCNLIPDQRPSSLANSATTTSTKKEGHSSSSGNGCARGMKVPVNSPNITDSGSSRPTTDTYDYVYIPVSRLSKDAILQHQEQFTPQSRHPPYKTLHRHSRRRNTSGKYASSSTSRGGSSIREATSRSSSRYYIEEDSGFSTPCSLSKRRAGRVSLDPRLESHPPGHFTVSGSDGNTRTVVRHSAVGRNLEPHRKRVLKKKLKQFNNLYHSTGNVNAHSIEVLGDF